MISVSGQVKINEMVIYTKVVIIRHAVLVVLNFLFHNRKGIFKFILLAY